VDGNWHIPLLSMNRLNQTKPAKFSILSDSLFLSILAVRRDSYRPPDKHFFLSLGFRKRIRSHGATSEDYIGAARRKLSPTSTVSSLAQIYVMQYFHEVDKHA
jgi:hypothetical protein